MQPRSKPERRESGPRAGSPSCLDCDPYALRRYPAEPHLPRKVLLVPAHRSLDPVDDMPGLANAVAFAWVADEDCLQAHILQCNVELLGLRKWHIVIVFTVNQHCRSGDLGNVLLETIVPTTRPSGCPGVGKHQRS